MYPQITCMRGCKITLVAFVWLFFIVRFQMCPQNVCPRRCIVTLIAFVQLFTTVRFQMCPQIAFLRRGIVTLVTFVWLHCAFLLHTLKFTFTFHFLNVFLQLKNSNWGWKVSNLGGWNVLFGGMKCALWVDEKVQFRGMKRYKSGGMKCAGMKWYTIGRCPAWVPFWLF